MNRFPVRNQCKPSERRKRMKSALLQRLSSLKASSSALSVLKASSRNTALTWITPWAHSPSSSFWVVLPTVPSPFHQQHLLPLQKDLLGWELPWNDVQMNASGFVLCKARDHSVMPLQTVQSHYYFVFCVLAQQRLRFLPAGPPDIQIAPVTAVYVPPGASRVPVLCHLLQLEPSV
jgi:hypothetical protein